MSRSTEFFEEPDGPACVGTDLVHSSLLTVEFLDDHKRDDHIVLVESEEGVWIGEKNTGVQHIGLGGRSPVVGPLQHQANLPTPHPKRNDHEAIVRIPITEEPIGNESR